MSIDLIVLIIERLAAYGASALSPNLLVRVPNILNGPDAHHLLNRLSEAALAFLAGLGYL